MSSAFRFASVRCAGGDWDCLCRRVVFVSWFWVRFLVRVLFTLCTPRYTNDRAEVSHNVSQIPIVI